MYQEKIATLSLPKSLEFLVVKLSEKDTFTSKEAAELLLRSYVQADDLIDYVAFDHEIDESYGKKVIYEGSNFEILAKSWAPGDFSAIHDHGISEWGAIKVFGCLEHSTFVQDQKYLTTESVIQFNSGVISTLDESLIHQMGNPTSHNILSLHIYGINQYAPKITQDSRIYDITSGMVFKTNGGAFFFFFFHQLKITDEVVLGDYPCWLSNLVHQISRTKKMAQFSRLKDLLYSLRSKEHRDRLNDFLEGKLDGEGRFISKNQEKIFAKAISSLGRLLGDYPHYHRKLDVRVQVDKFKSVFIVHLADKQLLLDYSHDKLVIS